MQPTKKVEGAVVTEETTSESVTLFESTESRVELRDAIEELLKGFNALRKEAKAQRKSSDSHRKKVAVNVCHMLDTLENVVRDARDSFNDWKYTDAWLAYGRADEQLKVVRKEFDAPAPKPLPEATTLVDIAPVPAGKRSMEAPPPSKSLIDTFRGTLHHARAHRKTTTKGVDAPKEGGGSK